MIVLKLRISIVTQKALTAVAYGVIGMLLRCREPNDPLFALGLALVGEARSFDGLAELASIRFRNWSLFMVAKMPERNGKTIWLFRLQINK